MSRNLNQFFLFIVLTALFSVAGAHAETNQLFGVAEDELTVIVNGREVTGAEKKARLQEQKESTSTFPKSDYRLGDAGIGAYIGLTKEGFTVILKLLPESPAAKVGLKQGDVIVAIDHDSAEGQDLMKVIQRLRGEVGSTVTLAISRAGLEVPLEVKITREPLSVQDGSGKTMGFMSRETATGEVVVIMRNGARIPAELLEQLKVRPNKAVEPTRAPEDARGSP